MGARGRIGVRAARADAGRRAAATAIATCVLAAGCGGAAEAPERAPAGDAAPCDVRRFEAALSRSAPGAPVRVLGLRCDGELAVTRASVGEARPLTLWRRDGGEWRAVTEGAPDRCRELVPDAREEALCDGESATEAADRARCATRAFAAAVRREITQGSVRIERIRCAGDRAITVLDLGDCPPEATATKRRACRRLATARWRAAEGRWVLRELDGAG